MSNVFRFKDLSDPPSQAFNARSFGFYLLKKPEDFNLTDIKELLSLLDEQYHATYYNPRRLEIYEALENSIICDNSDKAFASKKAYAVLPYAVQAIESGYVHLLEVLRDYVDPIDVTNALLEFSYETDALKNNSHKRHLLFQQIGRQIYEENQALFGESGSHGAEIIPFSSKGGENEGLTANPSFLISPFKNHFQQAHRILENTDWRAPSNVMMIALFELVQNKTTRLLEKIIDNETSEDLRKALLVLFNQHEGLEQENIYEAIGYLDTLRSGAWHAECAAYKKAKNYTASFGLDEP